MASQTGPLTEDHLRQINNALDVAKGLHDQIDMATRAGIDVSLLKAQLDEAEGRIRQVKSVYFPGR